MWTYNVLARELSRTGDDHESADKKVGAEATVAMLTGGSLPFDTIVTTVSDEHSLVHLFDCSEGIFMPRE